MITRTSGRLITAVLLAFILLTLSACDDKLTQKRSFPSIPKQEEALAQKETVSTQETAAQEEAVLAQEETVSKQEETDPTQGETVSIQQLPPEARQTLALIYQNGPFPYDRDGIEFGNREKLLPMERNGYYREYTVPTPGAKDRGARRIVCGGEKPSTPDRCYYTADHYLSFQLILDEAFKPDELPKP